MKGKNVFIVRTEFLCDGDDYCCGTHAYQEREDAQKFFNELVAKEKQGLKDKENWVTSEDSNTSFEAYEDGYYFHNHSVIRLMAIEIQ